MSPNALEEQDRMKISRESIGKFTIILSVGALLTLYGCGGVKKKNKGGAPAPSEEAGVGQVEVEEEQAGSDDATVQTAGSEENGDELRPDKPLIGIKNYLQINATFAALTGVAPDNNAVANIFEEVKGGLPGNNDIAMFSASVQNAIGKLAAEYCNEMVGDNTLREAAVPGFDFDGNVAASLNGAGVDTLVNGLVGSFWRGFESASDQMSVDMLKQLANDLKGDVGTAAADTRAVATGVCTAALAAPETVLL